MNKLIWIPLTTILIMSIIGTAYASSTSFSGNYTVNQYQGTTIDEQERNVTIPNAGEQKFSLTGFTMTMVILTTALTVAGVAGIHFLGSGLSEMTQRMIFLSIIYLGLWAVFSILAWQLFNEFKINDDGSIGILLWLVLTILYVTGVTSEITGTGSTST